MVLNRPKAILARSKPDPETRSSQCIWATFDEPLFGTDFLRMGYTHPMDDGQERTFKVKFEGEGVDTTASILSFFANNRGIAAKIAATGIQCRSKCA